jgi:hypothetical protein
MDPTSARQDEDVALVRQVMDVATTEAYVAAGQAFLFVNSGIFLAGVLLANFGWTAPGVVLVIWGPLTWSVAYAVLAGVQSRQAKARARLLPVFERHHFSRLFKLAQEKGVGHG